jgi:hypothetical protein
LDGAKNVKSTEVFMELPRGYVKWKCVVNILFLGDDIVKHMVVQPYARRKVAQQQPAMVHIV